jgi:hypothetical protein
MDPAEEFFRHATAQLADFIGLTQELGLAEELG